MTPNPYESPTAYAPAPAVVPGRRMFVLAAIGAGLASVYWAGLTLLIVLGAVMNKLSPLQIVIPCVLIVLYALRGVQIYRGDVAAAQRILWLHIVGGAMAVLQIVTGNPVVVVLYSIKIVIHVFGGVTAYLARRTVG